MSYSLVATLPVQSGAAARFLRALLSAIYEARARRAQDEIARHADFIRSARRHPGVLDARQVERRHG